MKRFYTIIGALLLFVSIGQISAQEVKAQLISELKTIEPGQKFWVAISMTMKEHWHTYWVNPGDSGVETIVKWTLPKGFTAGAIQWPYPHWFEVSGFATFGYEGDVYLLSQIQAAKELKEGQKIALKANVAWLACKEQCIPGDANVALDINVAKKAVANDVWKGKEYKAKLPQAHDWKVRAELEQNNIVLHMTPKSTFDNNAELVFFPETVGFVKYSTKQKVVQEGNSYSLQMEQDSDKTPKNLRGVLLVKEGDKESAWQIDVPFKTASAPAVNNNSKQDGAKDTPKPAPVNSSEAPGTWLAVVFAFIGGLILNLMPCVLPVLTIKILGFINEAGGDKSKIWRHGLIFAGGVLVSFWVLAGLLVALQKGGQQLGWGFQLQSPTFVLLIACLFFVIGLNLFGVFEVGTSLMGLGGLAANQTGWFSTFSSGVLATVVATPCTAPFMASALGVTLTAEAWVSFLIFTSLGLGMSTPYLLISFFPALLSFIPKPGPWMEVFKKVMGFPMMAASIWLIWVFAAQAGSDATGRLLLSLLAIAFGTWVLGHWGTPLRSKITRWVANVTFLVLLVGGIYYAIPQASGEKVGDKVLLFNLSDEHREGLELGEFNEELRQEFSKNKRNLSKDVEIKANEWIIEDKKDKAYYFIKAKNNGFGVYKNLDWIPFSPERVKELTAAKKPVFVDFTARWCITCQANKKVALRTTEVMAKFKQLGVVTMAADWTNHDETITKSLKAFGRNAVPLYVFYDKEGNANILPQILTKKIVIDALEGKGKVKKVEGKK